MPHAAIAAASVPILVVDDSAAKRLALQSVLEPLGYAVVEADSGGAALRCLLDQDFAVILLDVRMPLMTGFETAALIRTRKRTEMTPIIFMTAFSSDEIDVSARYAEGAVDFICSPVQPDELRAKVAVFANLFLKAEDLAAQAQAVSASADQLRLLTDAAPIGIFQTDAHRRYTYTNPRWTTITGISSDAAAGQAWGTIAGLEQSAIEPTAPGPGGAKRSQRFEIIPPDSAPRIVLATSTRVLGAGGATTGWVGTLADVTAETGAEVAMREARDRASEASQFKSDFLANMSHEIRTPMNGVIGMTDLLLETDLDERQRDFASTVRNSGAALLTIIDNILDFSKIESGNVEIERIEFDVRTLVEDLVDLLAGPAQAKGLELVALVGNSVPALVRGDAGRVRQVLTNLLGNALKFTQVGDVLLRVTASDDSGRGPVLRFEVIDTGEGIAPGKLSDIFQPFIQADSSTTRTYGGTGLGLAISSELIELMGGELGARSEPGAGSAFWFAIPMQGRSGESTAALPAPDEVLAGTAALIVDDNVHQQSVLSEYLTDWGMTVTTAGSGAAALTAMRSSERPFGVAVIDQAMPGMDGLELKDAIRSDASVACPVVLLTGLGQGRDLDEAARIGIAASASKPVHRSALLACLRTALGVPVVPAPPTAPSTLVSARDTEGDGMRLLVAEDNLINQKVAVTMLSNAGYRVDTALDGEAAVQAAARHSYHAILMDCQMPRMNGYQATAAIREREGDGAHTPIIAMTAGASARDRELCLTEGMDDYLAKPVGKDALLDAVARAREMTAAAR